MIPVTERKENTLCIGTFGGFCLFWNDRNLTDGPREGDSQIVRFLEALLHFGDKGLEKSLLKEILFDGRNVDDMSHGIRTVLYNTKKKLEKGGLPKMDYIISRNGRYYWNKAIPVLEDAQEFERLYQKAKKESDPEARLQLFTEAASFYTGEFLPLQAQMIWVFNEDKRYGEMFDDIAERCAELLRESGNYHQLESLGNYASEMRPFMGWETLTLEALCAQERIEEAHHLYESAENQYMSELGIKPFYGNTVYLEKLGKGITGHTYAGIDEIVEAIAGADVEARGGYICSWPVFQGICRMAGRVAERSGESDYLMLATIVDGEGKPIQDTKKLKTLSPKLADSICHSIRRSDAVCRYGDGQFLVLLVNISLEDCSIVQKRIDNSFVAGSKKTGVVYSCRNLREGLL